MSRLAAPMVDHTLVWDNRSMSARRRTPPVPRECLFCGFAGRLTEEHVFPKWLRALGYDGVGWRETLSGPQLVRTALQQGGPFTKTLKIVCGPCNNGWMSAMEDAAKPLLIEMFGTTPPHQVVRTPGQQLILARWAYKTICVIAQINATTPPRVPLAHCRTFYANDEIPQGVQMWIGTASIKIEDLGATLVESQIVPHNANVTFHGRTTVAPMYQGRFRLLNVVFDVTGTGPADNGDQVILESTLDGELARALIPIVPPTLPQLWWPPAQTLDAVGGISGMMKIPVTGLPTFAPNPPET